MARRVGWRTVRWAIAMIACCGFARAGDTAEADYLRDVKPVLSRRCYACHGALKQKANLRVDTAAALLAGGESGPVVEPGDAVESELIARVTQADRKLRMPPEGAPLSAEEIARIRTWIDNGASAPKGETPETDPREHWAFQRLTRPALPMVRDPAWLRNPIDAFLAGTYDREGLSPAPPAAPEVLLRRVYLDLIGLPPTRDELHAFVRDPSDAAYERVVDRLLARPEYGERWARHWMDVWRYSDWYGRRAVPDVTNSYAMIWRWRDWIVRSLNADRGYDRMVSLMLAADELAPDDDTEVVATGFVLRNFYRWNYNSWMKDCVEHTAKAFLGLTLQCAHCHDHKYDPLTQTDYFAFRAFFEPLEVRHDRVPGEHDPGPYPKYTYGASYKPITSGLTRVFDEKLDAKTYVYTRGESRNIVPGRAPVDPSVPAFLRPKDFHVAGVALPVAAFYPGLKAFVAREEIAKLEAALEKAKVASRQADAAHENARKGVDSRRNPPAFVGDERIAAFTPDPILLTAESLKAREAAAASVVARNDARNEVALAESRLAALHARIDADRARYVQVRSDAKLLAQAALKAERTVALEQSRIARERIELALVVARRKARDDPNAKAQLETVKKQQSAAIEAYARAEVDRENLSDQYSPLSPVYPERSTGRRSALARWITARDNPLAARVAVNHVWRWHFQRPIVATTHDFGRNGKPPSHRELLDWLAVELMEPSAPGARPWSLKHLHRLIVTTAAYRMDSRAEGGSAQDRSVDPENRWLWHFASARVEAEVLRDSMLYVAGALDQKLGGPDIPYDQGLPSNRRSLYFTHHGEARMPFLDLYDAPDACDAYVRTVSVVPQQALALTNNNLARTLAHGLSERLWRESATADDRRLDVFVTASFEQVLGRAPRPPERSLALRFLAGPSVGASATTPEARDDWIHALFNHHDFLTVH